jgi:hypothetical protein
VVTRAAHPIERIRMTTDRVDHFRLRTHKPGLVLGDDDRGNPVSISIFRPRATRMLVLGDAELTMLIAFRSLALGALIAVHSPRPLYWSPLAEHSADMERSAWARPRDWPERPRLTVIDGESRDDPPPDKPWATRLESWTDITTSNVDGLAAFDIVVIRRPPPDQAALLAAALALDDAQAAAIAGDPATGDVITVASRGTVHRVHLARTAVEVQLGS